MSLTKAIGTITSSNSSTSPEVPALPDHWNKGYATDSIYTKNCHGTSNEPWLAGS